MRIVVRSCLVALLAVGACARAGEPRPSSSAPALAESEATVRRGPLVGQRASFRATPMSAVPPPSAAPAPRPVLETVELTGFGTVRAEPRVDAPALGEIGMGARVEIYERVAGQGCSLAWLAVAPRGFVCAPSVPTRRRPTAVLPALPPGARVPGVYGSVAKDALVYESLAAAAAGEGGRLSESHLTVRRERTAVQAGRSFWKTRYGWVAEPDVRRFRGADFHGELLEDGLDRPLAWTLPPGQEPRVQVLAEPSAKATVITTIAARRARAVLDERDGFVQVDEGWIRREQVRVARRVEAPSGLGPTERWLDIDLSEQVLVAYEGAHPAYATLISSGRPGHRTPTGIFRISRKVAERTMNSMADASDSYRVDNVPWTAYFATGYALHAAFWHGGFGRTRSHGCVNLAPIDARALYDWMAPAAAPGWAEVYGHEAQPGSVVRIHDRRHREPTWRGYARAMRDAGAPAMLAAAPAPERAAG